MDFQPLVNPDLDAGADLVAALWERGLDVDFAAWVREPERDVWRLVLATPLSATAGRRAVYQTIESVLADNLDLRERLREIQLVDPTDPGVEDLRQLSVSSPGSLGTFPATTIAGEPFERGWVYNVAGVNYEHDVLRALQRLGDTMSVVIRRGERVFGRDSGVDFVVDRQGTPIAIEAKARLSQAVVDQVAALGLRLPVGFRMLVVSPEKPSPGDPSAMLDVVRWRSSDDDEELRDALTRLLAA